MWCYGLCLFQKLLHIGLNDNFLASITLSVSFFFSRSGMVKVETTVERFGQDLLYLVH